MFDKLLDFLSALPYRKFLVSVIAIVILVVIYFSVISCGSLNVKEVDWKYLVSEVENV